MAQLVCASFILFASLHFHPLVASAQAYAGGDLDGQVVFGLPAQEIIAVTFDAVSNATFPIKGYNTSIPGGPTDGTGSQLPGWSIFIGVAANVALAGSDDASVDKGQFIETTGLFIEPPAAIPVNYDTNSWRICAVIFAHGLGSAETNTAQTAQLDGSCTPLLPSECIEQLQVNSVASNSSTDDGCPDLDMPDVCAKHFSGESGTAYEITPSNDTTAPADDHRLAFFAAASVPTERDNDSAFASAERAVWPVLLTWTHRGAGGQAHDSAGWLSCIKAPNRIETERVGSSGGAEAVKRVSKWALLFGMGAAVLAFVA
ncbi:hypothetical protein B0T26DRAFT_650544 [Lasiosphaeria miniovina]|uniref:Uncharacterized protein n=1 Tax=Lasiosphaeria miniovina TaxID=1954250 RepID=A0AA40AAM1_9PEZI|nr:uncharacterized protein B0T26DRAFT_650544 [Lasiosphaeria miniovina]KAK0712373.1 hypothetical protein B0T26DRAFT_650544 [Lasiosphaeria miniovina]